VASQTHPRIAPPALAVAPRRSCVRAVLVTTASAATPPVPAYTSCNSLTAAPVLAEFDVPDGASLFKHFPALGITPEISNPGGPLHNGPLHIVALKGPVCNLPIYSPLLQPGAVAPLVFGNIIRVIKPDHDEWDIGYGDYDTFLP
jgi:hypothetical protein